MRLNGRFERPDLVHLNRPPGGPMKKSLLVFLAAFALLALPATARAQSDSTTSSTRSSSKAVNLTGTITASGLSFVADRDSRVWKVLNPELLRDAAGNRATVRAYLDAAKSEIRILSVRLGLQHVKVDDVAFRK
jgi:hypothetical protein